MMLQVRNIMKASAILMGLMLAFLLLQTISRFGHQHNQKKQVIVTRKRHWYSVLGIFHLCVPNRHAQWKHGIRNFVRVTSGSLATVYNTRHGWLMLPHWKSAMFLFRLPPLTVCWWTIP